MALIRDITEGTKNRCAVHDEVECLITSFTEHGERYLQLETFGSKERKLVGKVSQTIQLDRKSAAQLKRMIERTFPGV